MMFHEEQSAAQLARDEVTGLGSAMAGGKGKLAKTKRRAYDFYPTPAECTRALMLAEKPAIAAHFAKRPFFSFKQTIWEPCGHGGAVARVLKEFGFDTRATDIRADPANNVLALDLLATTHRRAPVVITNTPFALAHKMIVHLLGRLDVDYLALLLKTTFFSTSSEDRGRVGLWRDHPPSRRWDMGFRPDFTHAAGDAKRSPTMLCSWFVWDKLRPNPLGGDFYGMVPTGLLLRDGPVRFGRGDMFSSSTDVEAGQGE